MRSSCDAFATNSFRAVSSCASWTRMRSNAEASWPISSSPAVHDRRAEVTARDPLGRSLEPAQALGEHPGRGQPSTSASTSANAVASRSRRSTSRTVASASASGARYRTTALTSASDLERYRHLGVLLPGLGDATALDLPRHRRHGARSGRRPRDAASSGESSRMRGARAGRRGRTLNAMTRAFVADSELVDPLVPEVWFSGSSCRERRRRASRAGRAARRRAAARARGRRSGTPCRVRRRRWRRARARAGP